MPFFSCFWQKINAFMPWAVLSVQKKAAALIWPLHEWQGFLRRHFCHRSLNLKQEKWFFMKRTMSEKKKEIVLSTSVILTRSQCYKIMRMNYVETCKTLQYTLTKIVNSCEGMTFTFIIGRLYLQVTADLCGGIFHVKFQVDSESGLRSDLRGRASELRGWVQNHIKITWIFHHVKPFIFQAKHNSKNSVKSNVCQPPAS